MTEAPWRRRFRAPRMSLPTWAREAPDRLLYLSNAEGKWEVYAWDRAAGRHRRVTDRPEGTLEAAIDPTGEWVWWFDDERGNERGRWMVEPFGGGEPRVAAPGLPPAFSSGLAVGRGFAIVGSAADDGSRAHLVRPGEAPRLLYAHREEAEVAGLSRDDRLLCLTHAEHGDSRHPALRVLDLDGRTVADLWDGPGLGLTPAGWSPVPGDRRLLVLHERQGLARPLVFRPEAEAASEIDLDLPGDVDAAWYPDASALLLVHEHRGRSELYRYDLGSGRLARLEIEPGTVEQAGVRPDGEVWYAWSRASTPPEIRVGARVLVRPPGDPAPGGAAYTDHVVDGVHLFVAEPPGPGPHPTLLEIHGGPHAHERDEFDPYVQAWVDHGFAVILPNYRGSSGYGRAWRDAIEGNPGLTELEDLARVRAWAVAERIADPARIVVAGASWGGYLTLLALGLLPDLWALGIAAVPVADYVAAYEDEMEPLRAFDRALFGGSPAEIPTRYEERSPIRYVERVRVPVLLLAGANDPRCPIRQIERYIERLRQLGKPHEVYRYDAGHGSLVVEERIRQVEVAIGFAARHLGTRPPL